jgi:hypothetical protein
MLPENSSHFLPRIVHPEVGSGNDGGGTHLVYVNLMLDLVIGVL